MRYIALLRGINVGGKNKIKMIDLKNLFEGLDFKNVETYIQSGNVIFDSETTDCIKLAGQIQEKISEIYEFVVITLILTAEELRNIVNNNPFVKEPNIELDKLHITFMFNVPEPSKVSLLNIKKEENEKFLIIRKVIYLYCPNGYGRTKLTNTSFEKKLNTIATTRNWLTVNNIIGMI